MKNPVAKNLWKTSKKKVHRDKTKYNRKDKSHAESRKRASK